MIDAELRFQCDGETDEEMCEAEFTVGNYGGPNISPVRVAHELRQRGWITVRRLAPSGEYHEVFCPLHAEPEEFENPDQDQTMVDLGGGMVVPLSELMDDDR